MKKQDGWQGVHCCIIEQSDSESVQLQTAVIVNALTTTGTNVSHFTINLSNIKGQIMLFRWVKKPELERYFLFFKYIYLTFHSAPFVKYSNIPI